MLMYDRNQTNIVIETIIFQLRINKFKKMQPLNWLGSPFKKFQLDALEAPSPGGDSKGEEATQHTFTI